ncbi:MAG TPA: class I SAM-dependent methyltransferase [Bellilinea sp.]|nr:class I SAM-dependent methyltransferase [Bellilinea sp.]
MSADLFPASDFDAWAPTYDQDTAANSGFPFERYSQVLQTVLRTAQPYARQMVLDLGAGTGNLTALFVAAGCRVWGTDYSSEMLVLARQKLPQVTFVQTDIRDPRPGELPEKFDTIVSGYAFHHFITAEKVRLIHDLAVNHLTPGGRIVIADIAFASLVDQEAERQAQGKEWNEEYYWVADVELPALRAVGLQATFESVSQYAGVFQIIQE